MHNSLSSNNCYRLFTVVQGVIYNTYTPTFLNVFMLQVYVF